MNSVKRRRGRPTKAEAPEHLIMQVRKVVSVGTPLILADESTTTISGNTAERVLEFYNRLIPTERQRLVKIWGKSAQAFDEFVDRFIHYGESWQNAPAAPRPVNRGINSDEIFGLEIER